MRLGSNRIIAVELAEEFKETRFLYFNSVCTRFTFSQSSHTASSILIMIALH